MNHRSLQRLILLASVVLSTATARAQSADSAMAQALFDQAKELLANGHAAEACPKLEESQRLEPRSGTLINLAKCYEQTQRLASAWSKYVEAAAAARIAGNLERETVARDQAAALAPRVSKIIIVVAPALVDLTGLDVMRDGASVGKPGWGVALPSDAGEHQVTARAPGYEPFSARVNVTGEGQTMTVNVPMLAVSVAKPVAPPAAPAGPSPTVDRSAPVPAASASAPVAPPPTANHGLGTGRVGALVAGGVGVVGLGVGTVFGLVSKSKHDEAEKYCAGSACRDQRGVTAGNAAQSAGNISTVAMIVGGVGAVVGVTLWLTATPTHGDSRHAQLVLAPGSLQVMGAF